MRKYHMVWVFIVTKPGEKYGRIHYRRTLDGAKKERSKWMKKGYKCSKIAKIRRL